MSGVIVIGVGNPYRRDDGVGAAVVARLRQRGLAATLVTSLGETTELIELWEGADLAILVDAVVTARPEPGTTHRLTLDAPLPEHPSASTHSAGLGEAVDLARALGRLPARLVLYAVEPVDVGHGEGLSPLVAAEVDHVAGHIEEDVVAFRTGASPAGPVPGGGARPPVRPAPVPGPPAPSGLPAPVPGPPAPSGLPAPPPGDLSP